MHFLARQGLPLRGHGDESDSKFTQLLRLRAEDDSQLHDWVEKKSDKYTSPQIQNEIMTIMANTVPRGVASSVRSAPFYSLMVDETTDSSCEEQVVICCRWIDDDLQAHEDFWEFVLQSSQSHLLSSELFRRCCCA